MNEWMGEWINTQPLSKGAHSISSCWKLGHWGKEKDVTGSRNIFW